MRINTKNILKVDTEKNGIFKYKGNNNPIVIVKTLTISLSSWFDDITYILDKVCLAEVSIGRSVANEMSPDNLSVHIFLHSCIRLFYGSENT